MNSILRKHKRIFDVFLYLFWITFAYIWLTEWGKVVLFNEKWWFDIAGHALFGFAGTITLLYRYHIKSSRGVYYIAGYNLLSREIITRVGLYAIVWEFIELLYDLQIHTIYPSWLAKAQESSIDTSLDVLVAVCISTITMIGYVLFNKAYEKLYPDDFIKEKKSMLEDVMRHVNEEIVQHKKEHRMELYSSLFKMFKRLRKKHT